MVYYVIKWVFFILASIRIDSRVVAITHGQLFVFIFMLIFTVREVL